MTASMIVRLSRILLPAAALSLVLAACGSSTVTEQVATGGDSGIPVGGGALPFGLQRCSLEFTVLAADPTYYRDEPVYVGNNQPIEELRAWAADKPGYEDVWIDRNHNGWVSIGFSEGAADRQAELEETFPDYGAVAVAVVHGNDDLEALRREVFAVLEASGGSWGGGHSVASGLVTVSVGVLDEETLGPLADFAGRPVCFEGVDPEGAVIDGPQPTGGEGWRLLASERTGEPYRTGVASDDGQYADLWRVSGLTGQRPAVDFESEIVIWLGAVYGSGCEIRLDDVVFDRERSLVHGEFVIPGNPTACNADANPEAYVVAVERSRLPAGPFAVQLGPDDPPGGAPEERTKVDADLSQPSTVAPAGAIGRDPELMDRPDLGYVIGAGGVMEPGFGAVYRLDLSCDFNILGPVNGVMWGATDPVVDDDGRAAPDPAWSGSADGDGVLLADVLLDEERPSLSLSANGHTVEYRPAPSDAGTDCP